MTEKFRVQGYATIMLKNEGLATAVEEGTFTIEEVERAARLVQETREAILGPGGPRGVVGQAEVYDHAALRLGPTKANTSARRVQVLLKNMAADTGPKRIFFTKSCKLQV